MYPYRPVLSERANCGPTVLATILECHSETAIHLMEKHNEGGWNGYTNVGHIRNALKARGGSFKKVTVLELDFMDRTRLTACFLQITGPWMGKGWRNEYTHTHWALFQFGYCMDVNNPLVDGKPIWIPISEWKRDTMPRVVASYEGGNGWSLRGAYSAVVP